MFRRVAVSPQAAARSKVKSLLAPTRGWVTNENLAGSGKRAALVLDNWFVTQQGIRLRGGSQKYATLPGAVESMFRYVAGNNKFLFASDASGLYDVTSPGDATTPQVAVQAFGGDISTAVMETSGGTFLRAVNGTDTSIVFDGSAWATTPAVTGFDTALASQVFTYRSRIFFVQKNSARVWFLPVDVVGGAALDFSLAGIFQRGGSILFGSTWSYDTGDGLDDMVVFVSTEGEVAVYQGGNPGDASDWNLVGRYDITRPLGPKAVFEAGGDLIIATQDGAVPISQVPQKDPAALSLAAVSRPIEPDWQTAALSTVGRDWAALKWPEQNMALFSIPSSSGDAPECFVVNIETGAWSRFTGWDVSCFGLLDGQAYFGTPAGTIMKAEVGGTDDGAVIEHCYVGHFEELSSRAVTKVVNLARARFRASRNFIPKVSVSTDYTVRLPAAPNAAAQAAEDTWDVGVWDTAKWSGGSQKQIHSRWRSVHGVGDMHAPQIQVVSGAISKPDAELISIDLMYELGAIVV